MVPLFTGVPHDEEIAPVLVREQIHGRTEWRWQVLESESRLRDKESAGHDVAVAEIPTISKQTLEQAVAALSVGAPGVKRMADLLRTHRPHIEFTNRDLRAIMSTSNTARDVAVGGNASSASARAPPHQAPDVASRLATHLKTFVIRSAGESGFGAFATRAIKRGERILCEAPLVMWTIVKGASTASLEAIVATLDPVDRDDFFGLCQNDIHGPTKSAYGIWLSNAFPTESPLARARDALSGHLDQDADRQGACFAAACRFNHSCSPSSHLAWNPRRGKGTIHALVDIAAGDEITISYLGSEQCSRRDERQAKLREDFGFTCGCAKCTNITPEAVRLSDARRSRLGALSTLISISVNGIAIDGSGGRLPRTRTNAIDLVEERLSLLAQDGIGNTWDTMYAACAYSRSVGDRAQATHWASRAAASARVGLGCDSEEYQKYVALVGTRKVK